VRRDAGRYYVHQVDRDYALSRIPEGEPAGGTAEIPPLILLALRRRAAEWFKLSRKPREAWKSLEDLTAQLSEFDLRCEAEDYDTAAALFLEFDFDNLLLWGHYRLMTERHERLHGKITDSALAQQSVGNLGSAYFRMGYHQRAMVCYQEALRLARESRNKGDEGIWLGNLGICVAELGRNRRAIEYLQQALAIARGVGHRTGEATHLGNLGERYSEIGQVARAIDCYKEALDIDREIEDEASEVFDLANLSESYIDLGQYEQALEYFKASLTKARKIGNRYAEAQVLTCMGRLYFIIGRREEAAASFEQSIQTADEIGNIEFQKLSRTSAAIASLCTGDLAAAQIMAVAADRHHFPVEDAQTSTVLGIVAYRQKDLEAAREAFTAAIAKAGELLAMTPDRYAALDAKALALCGLALCGNTRQMPAARTAFMAARKVTCAAGVVTWVLQLFDALAVGDANHVLSDLRPVAAGQISQSG
jgi:tetratricopeptide (TPR) repeat protein